MKSYQRMTLPEIKELNRDKTIFLMAISPLEVHGPHLPVGTDLFIAQALLTKYGEELAQEYPGYFLLQLPPLYTGANPVPAQGSIPIRARVLEKLVYDIGQGLAEQGFHYLFLADNHGGPGHQLALEAAARKLWKKYHFYLINPFGLVFRYMVQHDRAFLAMTGLEPGVCGDDPDSHAGTNETSLMLYLNQQLQQRGEAGFDFNYQQLESSVLPERTGIARLISGLARVLNKTGARILAADLLHLANTLAWVGDPVMKHYLGAPGRASAEAGRAMFEARISVAMSLFKKALAGERVEIKPMLWSVRFLRWFG